jgi:hypothetical protein
MFEEIIDGTFDIEAGGRTLHVVFTMNAMEALETKGLDVEGLDGKGLPVYERCLTMLWAGTREYHGDPNKPDYLSREDLGRLIQPCQLAEVNQTVDRAILAAFTPKKKVNQEPEKVKPTGS